MSQLADRGERPRGVCAELVEHRLGAFQVAVSELAGELEVHDHRDEVLLHPVV